MSKLSTVTIVNPNHIDIINSSHSDQIFLVAEADWSIDYKYIDKVLKSLENDRVGMVISDFAVKQNGFISHKYLDGLNLPDVPFFVKKLPIRFFPNTKIMIMQSIIKGGYFFDHIAEPILIHGN